MLMTAVSADVVACSTPRSADSLADMSRNFEGMELVCRLIGGCFVRCP